MHHLWALGSLRRFLNLSPIFWDAFLSGVTTLENFCKEKQQDSRYRYICIFPNIINELNTLSMVILSILPLGSVAVEICHKLFTNRHTSSFPQPSYKTHHHNLRGSTWESAIFKRLAMFPLTWFVARAGSRISFCGQFTADITTLCYTLENRIQNWEYSGCNVMNDWITVSLLFC